MTHDMGALPPTCAVADVLLLGGARGWLSPPLQLLGGSSACSAAPAFTVLVEPAEGGGGLGRLFELIDSGVLDGRSLVLAGAADVPGAVWGEILTLATERAGATSLVIDGFARDLLDLPAGGPPLWARSECTVGPGPNVRLVSVDEPVSIGGAEIAPGDLVISDSGGLVSVPSRLLDQTIDRAERYADAEAAVVAALRNGATATEAYRNKAEVVRGLQDEGPL